MFRPAVAGPSKIVTANRLDDGRVVFLDTADDWTPEIDEARLLADGPELEAATAFSLEQQKARVIIEPYAVDVDANGGKVVPIRLRERIRAIGPSVDYGHEERARLDRQPAFVEAAE